jgi:hypothetical protein
MRISLVAATLAVVLAASTVAAEARCPQYDNYPDWAYKAFCTPFGG